MYSSNFLFFILVPVLGTDLWNETFRINATLVKMFYVPLDPDPGEEGKSDPEKYNTVNEFHLLKCWMFSFEGSRLLL
jgi:hypothetical protein